MDASELASYEEQLAQVKSALALDENNADLRTLEGELTNLINLTRQLVQGSSGSEAEKSKEASVPRGDKRPRDVEVASQTSTAQSLSKKHTASLAPSAYNVGDECDAKYAADGRWYPARIVSVGGSRDNPLFTVLFKGYGNTEVLTAQSLRGGKRPASSVSHATAAPPAERADGANAPQSTLGESDAERERKRKRNEKKAERHASKTAEANAMQSSWQKFAKKAEKKGAIKSDKSMFKTPDDPLAKVGVVGAGRGMTQYHDRKKHTYDSTTGQGA